MGSQQQRVHNDSFQSHFSTFSHSLVNIFVFHLAILCDALLFLRFLLLRLYLPTIFFFFFLLATTWQINSQYKFIFNAHSFATKFSGNRGNEMNERVRTHARTQWRSPIFRYRAALAQTFMPIRNKCIKDKLLATLEWMSTPSALKQLNTMAQTSPSTQCTKWMTLVWRRVLRLSSMLSNRLPTLFVRVCVCVCAALVNAISRIVNFHSFHHQRRPMTAPKEAREREREERSKHALDCHPQIIICNSIQMFDYLIYLNSMGSELNCGRPFGSFVNSNGCGIFASIRFDGRRILQTKCIRSQSEKKVSRKYFTTTDDWERASREMKRWRERLYLVCHSIGVIVTSSCNFFLSVASSTFSHGAAAAAALMKWLITIQLITTQSDKWKIAHRIALQNRNIMRVQLPEPPTPGDVEDVEKWNGKKNRIRRCAEMTNAEVFAKLLISMANRLKWHTLFLLLFFFKFFCFWPTVRVSSHRVHCHLNATIYNKQ